MPNAQSEQLMEIVFSIILGIIAFVIFNVLLILIIVLFLSIPDAIKRPFERKADKIKHKYPLAYNNFLDKNHISRNSVKFIDLLKITNCSIDFWNEEETRLQEKEQIRRETETKYKEIEKSFPEGLKKWRKLNPSTTKEIIISNKQKIKDYDTSIKEAQVFNAWEEEQKEFTKKCRDLVDITMPDFGCYPYQVPFIKTNDEGESINGNYKVWQSFVGSYCLETDLDYVGFKRVKENTNNLDEFKNRSRYYLSSVYEKIRHFIVQLSNDYPISVYLCANNQNWSAESLQYHYYLCGDGAPFYDLPNNVEVCDPVTDALLNEKEIDYNNYPTLKNRHIVIVEMQTDNEHLKKVCKNIIEKNKGNKPLITYISFLKGYDRKEMEKLIDDERNKKKEEEERKRREREAEEKRRKELEKFKPEKDAIIRLLDENNIHCFYHFTAKDNLALIKKHGGLYSWWSLKQKKIDVPFLGGEGFGQQLDMRYGLQDYVRLSFCDDHPMIFKHQQNGIDLVLLKIDTEVATWKGTLFSDINATDNDHHHGDALSDLRMVDFHAVKRNFVRRDDEDFKPHQAEIMVKTFIPIQYIKNIDSPLYL